MDRIDEWRVFATVAQRKSFAAAARALGRSPQAITRAIAALEARVGVRLLHRTTRSVSLSADGARYLDQSRLALQHFDELEAGPTSDLNGPLHITAPVLFGQLHVAPLVRELLATHAPVRARLLLTDAVLSLADAGVDVAVRIGALPDSALRARVVRHVRLVTIAAPAYLARAGTPRTPAHLADHACIAGPSTPNEQRWTYGRRTVPVVTRLAVTTAQAAIDAAVAAFGITRVVDYQVEHLVATGALRVILAAHEPARLPVHLVHLPGPVSRAATAFLDLATARLRAP